MNPKNVFYITYITWPIRVHGLVMLLLCLYAMPVMADIFKCQGDSGIPAFVDDKTKRSGNYRDCVLYMRADNQPITPRKINHIQTDTSQRGGESFPRIDGQTQSRMDSKRKQILQEELMSEQQALQESKKQLQEAQMEQLQKPSSPVATDRLARLQKEIEGHQSNIRLLGKELSAVNTAGK